MLGLYYWAESLRKKREDDERRELENRIRRACKVCKGSGSVGHYAGFGGSCSYSMGACFNCSGLSVQLAYHMRGIQGLRDDAAKAEAEAANGE